DYNAGQISGIFVPLVDGRGNRTVSRPDADLVAGTSGGDGEGRSPGAGSDHPDGGHRGPVAITVTSRPASETRTRDREVWSCHSVHHCQTLRPRRPCLRI